MTRAPHPTRHRSRTALGAALAVAVLDLFVIGVAVRTLVDERREQYADAARTAQNLARVLGANLDGTLDAVDVALIGARVEIERQAAAGGLSQQRLTELLTPLLDKLGFLDAIRFADAEGRVLLGTGLPADRTVNVADRDYFQRAKADGAALHVSQPLVGRISGKWSLCFARRTSEPDGSFGGVVYATATVEQLTRSLGRVNVGDRGAVILRGADQALIARYPALGPAQNVGNRTISPELTALLAAGRTEGTFVAKSPIDHEEKVIAFRHVAGGSFLLLVAVSPRDFLAAWRSNVVRVSFTAGAFVFLTAIGAWLLVRSWRRESAATFRALVEGAPIAVTVARGTTIAYVNPAFVKAFGLPHAEAAVGRSLVDNVLPADAARTADRIARRMRGDPVEPTTEITLLRPDGSAFLASVTDAMVELVDGPTVVGFIQDVTERRRSEEERERLIGELKAALADVKTLRGLLPICAHCKKIRDDRGYWNRIETFIQERSDADFTHGICPDCARIHFPEDDPGKP